MKAGFDMIRRCMGGFVAMDEGVELRRRWNIESGFTGLLGASPSLISSL